VGAHNPVEVDRQQAALAGFLHTYPGLPDFYVYPKQLFGESVLKRLQWTICLIVCVLVSGCATTQKGPAYPVAKLTPASTDKAKIYVYRKYAMPTVWTATIMLGDQTAASLVQETFTVFDVAPGNSSIRATWPLLSGQITARINVDVKAGETYFIELTSDFTRNPISHAIPGLTSNLVLADKGRAESDLNGCCSLVESLIK